VQRGAHRSREEWLESGRFAIDLLCEALGKGDLRDIELLDVGCGTKLVKTILDESRPVGSYTGVDVSTDVIAWLEANVSDPRFAFHHLDAKNAMYRPEGVPLESFEFLPMGPSQVDAICLFSVFTHLAPQDFDAMLRLLHRHSKPSTTLVFSLFLADLARRDAIARAIASGLESEDPDVRRRTNAAIAGKLALRDPDTDPRFTDEIPGHPLLVARYEIDYALELVHASGWEVIEVRPPVRPFIQDHMICRPAGEAS